jgi:hypothetical protein
LAAVARFRIGHRRKENIIMNSFRKHKAAMFAGGLALVLMIAPALKAQISADEALAKRYEKILGRYEFDLTTMGGEMRVIEVVVRQGALWVDDGDGRPAEIKPVNDSDVEFAGADAVNGPVQAKFIKDDTGTVVKFRLVLPNVNIDITGTKLK